MKKHHTYNRRVKAQNNLGNSMAIKKMRSSESKVDVELANQILNLPAMPDMRVLRKLTEEEQASADEVIKEFLEKKEQGDIRLSEVVAPKDKKVPEEPTLDLTKALQIEKETLEDTTHTTSPTPLPVTPVTSQDTSPSPLPVTKLRAYKITDKGLEMLRPLYKWKITYYVGMEKRQTFRPGEITVYSEEAFRDAYLALIRAALTSGEVAVILCEDNRYNSIKLTITKESIEAFNNMSEDSMDKEFELIVGDRTLVLKVSELLEKRPLTLYNLTPDYKCQVLENSDEEIMLRRAV